MIYKLDFSFNKLATKLNWTLLLVALFVSPSYTYANTVFETTDWIIGTQGSNHSFTANLAPYTYQATLSDLSPSPLFGFDFLSLSITSSTESLGTIVGPGTFTFDVVPGQTLFANVFGTGGGTQGAGLLGVKISAVPIPAALPLFGSALGFIGLVGWRKRK